MPEELLLISLRAPQGSGRGSRVARTSVRRTLVLLALTELMLVGRMRQAASRADGRIDRTHFGDAGTDLPRSPLTAYQQLLRGTYPLRTWVKHYRHAVESLTTQALAGRDLVTIDGQMRPTLTRAGTKVGTELRASYARALRGEFLVPAAESLWLTVAMAAVLNSKVFRDGVERVRLAGFRQGEPFWFTVTEARPDIEAMFEALRHVPEEFAPIVFE